VSVPVNEEEKESPLKKITEETWLIGKKELKNLLEQLFTNRLW